MRVISSPCPNEPLTSIFCIQASSGETPGRNDWPYGYVSLMSEQRGLPLGGIYGT